MPNENQNPSNLSSILMPCALNSEEQSLRSYFLCAAFKKWMLEEIPAYERYLGLWLGLGENNSKNIWIMSKIMSCFLVLNKIVLASQRYKVSFMKNPG